MVRESRPTSNTTGPTTTPSSIPGTVERGLVGAISADQVTNVQVGTSGSGASVQPATSDNAGKK